MILMHWRSPLYQSIDLNVPSSSSLNLTCIIGSVFFISFSSFRVFSISSSMFSLEIFAHRDLMDSRLIWLTALFTEPFKMLQTLPMLTLLSLNVWTSSLVPGSMILCEFHCLFSAHPTENSWLCVSITLLMYQPWSEVRSNLIIALHPVLMDALPLWRGCPCNFR